MDGTTKTLMNIPLSTPHGHALSPGAPRPGRSFLWLAPLAALLVLLGGAPPARADRVPANCTGSGLGISLFTSAPDVHVGDTLFYSINVFNGALGSGRIACDAVGITAFIVTPDGVTNNINLVRTTLHQGESDFYLDVVSYVVRAQDIQPDGTLLATARDIGVIHQNDTDSIGGGFQGVNTEVSLPCVLITALCVGGVGENGLIQFSGTVTNCGNNTLVGVTVTNFFDNGFFTVLFPTNLARGQAANFSGSWIPLNPCIPSVAILTVRATDEFTSNPRTVTNFTTYACQNTTTPGILVTKVCPVGPVAPGQLLTFSGSVSNTGNVTLTNIVVLNNQPAANTPVFTLASLAPGAAASFTGSYLAPTNCSVADTLTATATSRCGVGVSSTASATCPITTTPAIVVTAACPATPILPGGSFLYTGTVRNSGNITLNNVVVTSDRPAANTTIFTVASLAPGASASFSTTVTVPANACTVTTAFSARGQDICTLNSVTNTTATTCTVTTAPAIAVTLACPASPATTGGLIVFTGTVRNSGNVTLNNVFVVNNQPFANTPVIGPLTILPGVTVPFTATFTAPADACSVSSTVSASGNDNCTGALVSNAAAATCSLLTTPALVVTQTCPVGPAVPGGLLNYTGTVRNSGNITLTNVVVLNNLSGASPVFTALTLAPGVTASFSGSYLAPTNCSSTSIATATASSICGTSVSGTVSTTCTILTAPAIVVTASCPVGPILPGGSIVYTGTVRNSGNITLDNVVVTSDRPSANTEVRTIASLAPGAVASFSATVTVPANACAVATTFSGRGRDVCTLNNVTNTTVTTCTVTTAPAIAVTLACPGSTASTGSLIVFSGTVRNSGNVTLNNVFVVNNQPSANTPVIGPLTILPGVTVPFTTTFTAPADACLVSSTVSASGTDNCTGALVSNAAAATCSLLTTPGILVTKVCPVGPVAPGQLLTFSGSVSNTGNVTLTNIVVLNNQPAANTSVFTLATLAPGAVASFTGSYLAPTNCSVADTLTATATSRCGVGVSSVATATCPIFTTPRIVVTQICPINPVLPGGILTYSGTVSNAGNITLTNIIVVSDQPGSNTVIFTRATLAAGASASFSGSYQVPTNCCVSTSTVRATGQGCLGETVSDTATRTCTVLTMPALEVTKLCPPGALRAGDLLVYSGTVRNSGNITLFNVTVVNTQPVNNTLVLGPLTLAPGESAFYTASYIVPVDFCGLDTVTATGFDICTFLPTVQSVTTTCPMLTSPRITVTKNCPVLPTPRGGLFTFTGSVSNAGNVTLLNVFVVDNQPTNNTPVIGPITLAPGASVNFSGSYLAPNCDFDNCCFIIDTLTATGRDRCSGVNVSATATTFCPLLITPSVTLVQACPPSPIPMGSVYSYSGYVTNTGNIVLTNVFVFGPQGTNSPVLGPIELAPGESEFYFGTYAVPFNICTVPVTAFAQSVCGGEVATNMVSCPVATTTLLAVTQNCPAAPVSAGGLLTYSGSVSNAGNVTINDVVVLNNLTGATPVFMTASLLPGASASFSGSYVAPAACFTTSTSTATGLSICGVGVTNSASSTCPVLTTTQISITQNCPVVPAVPGGLLNYSGVVSNAGTVTLTNVVILNNLSGASPVFTAATLAPGAAASYAGSYLAPNACSSTSISTVTARNVCGIAVTNTASTTCPITTTPLLGITQNCPAIPASSGGLLVYSGTVSNAGNVTLNGIVVTNSQSGNTPLISVATLLPGASTNFTGSYLAPTTGPTTASTSTARATSLCGVPVVNSASSTCPIISTPAVDVYQLCPPAPVAPGGTLTFTGTAANLGNVTLTNVLVVGSQPAPNTPVLGPITLAPGASMSFTGSYAVPLDACSTSNTVTITGQDASTGASLTNTATAICPVLATPMIMITQDCPPGPLSVGDSAIYSGTVSNSGNITLTNVFVLTSHPTNNSPLLGPLTLAPGDSAPFSGSYLVTGGSNPVTNTFIVTNITVTITTNQPTTTHFGTIDSTSEVVVDRFVIGTNFFGLTYAPEDHGYAATQFYSIRKDDGAGTSFFDTITASTGTTTDRFNAGNHRFDALTYAAPDVGFGPTIFYYLSRDSAGVSTFGSITPGGVVGVTTPHFEIGTNVVALTFTATDLGYGANMFYYIRQDTNGLSTFGTFSPALPGVITDRFTVGTNVHALVFTDLNLPGYGPNNFYYLRDDTNGVSTFGTIFVTGLNSALVNDQFAVGTNVAELTFTATDTGSFGPNLFYYLRGSNLSITTNTVTTFTTNTFVTFTPTNTVSAVGTDLCRGRTVAAAADCTGPVSPDPQLTPASPPPSRPVISPSNSFFTLSFPTEGGVLYTIQYKDTLNDADWISLTSFYGTGGDMSVIDPTDISENASRFYRIILLSE